MKKIRPIIVGIVLVVSLVAFFGTQYVVKTYRFEEPFKEQVLSIDGVRDVKLVNGANEMKIFLTVTPEIKVQEAVQKVKKIGSEFKGNITIEIETASPALADIYQDMHFAVYEGIASGKFTTMATQVKEIADESKVDEYTVQVDGENVYLKLVQDDEVFVKVVSRGERVAYLNTVEGGESQW